MTKKIVKKKVIKKKTTKKKVVKKVAKKVVRKRKPKNTDIIMTSPIDPSSQIVMSSELADDSMIEAELMGEVLPHYIYEFDQKGKKITGLTVKGVNEVVRRLNRNKKSGYKITFPPEHMKVERDVSYDGVLGIEVRVFAVNLIDGTSAWGIKFEPYKKSGRNGSYENTFAIEKALSKAERNAKRKLIPETVATKMIEKMIKADPNSVQRLAPVENKQISVTPTQPRPSTKAEVQKVITDAIKYSNDISQVIDFDEKVSKDKRFANDEDFKNQVHQLANLRVNQLQEND